MLLGMSRGNAGVMQGAREHERDLRRVYGEQLDKKRGHWFVWQDATKDSRELYAFAVAQTQRRFGRVSFYIYDLLRLLPMLKSR